MEFKRLFNRPWRLMDEGKGVEVIKARLQELGRLKEPEPGFGPATERAVTEFQKDRGLAPDGVVGPATWARLFPPQPPSREYINGELYGGQAVFDDLDGIVAGVCRGEGNAFDALNLDGDGQGLSFGILQWSQNQGRLGGLLQACRAADAARFSRVFGDGSPEAAQILVAKTQGPGKRLPLWRGEWPLRFWMAGRDQQFQKVQRRLARQETTALLDQGYARYPREFKPGGRISLRALVMMADVLNQAGPGGLLKALKYAAGLKTEDEAKFIRALGERVEKIIAANYGDPNYGNTRGRHDAICRNYPLDRVEWQTLKTAPLKEDKDPVLRS